MYIQTHVCGNADMHMQVHPSKHIFLILKILRSWKLELPCMQQFEFSSANSLQTMQLDTPKNHLSPTKGGHKSGWG